MKITKPNYAHLLLWGIFLLTSCRARPEAVIAFHIRVKDNKGLSLSGAEVFVERKSLGRSDNQGLLKKTLFLNKESSVLIEVKKESPEVHYSPFMKRETLSSEDSQPLELEAVLYSVPKLGAKEEGDDLPLPDKESQDATNSQVKPNLAAKMKANIKTPPVVVGKAIPAATNLPLASATLSAAKKELVPTLSKNSPDSPLPALAKTPHSLSLLPSVEKKVEKKVSPEEKQLTPPSPTASVESRYLKIYAFSQVQGHKRPLAGVDVLIGEKKLGKTSNKGTFSVPMPGKLDSFVEVTLLAPKLSHHGSTKKGGKEKKHWLPERFTRHFTLSASDIKIQRMFTDQTPSPLSTSSQLEGTVLRVDQEGKVVINIGSFQDKNLRASSSFSVFGTQINEGGNHLKNTKVAELILQKIGLATSEGYLSNLKSRAFVYPGDRVVFDQNHPQKTSNLISTKDKSHKEGLGEPLSSGGAAGSPKKIPL